MTKDEELLLIKLTEKHKIYLTTICIKKYGFSESDSEEIIEDVFFRLALNISKVKMLNAPRQFKWLLTTTDNVTQELIRERLRFEKRPIEAYEDIIVPQDPTEEYITKDTLENAFRELLSELSNDEGKLLNEIIVGNKNYKKDAERENINYNTFKSKKRRTMKRLKRKFIKICNKHEIIHKETNEYEKKGVNNK